MALSEKMVVYSNLNGGLNSRTTPLLTEANAKQRMQSVGLRNVDFFPTGGIAKRRGKTKQGNSLINSVYASQATHSTTKTVTAAGTGFAFAQKITTVAAFNLQSVDFYTSVFSANTPINLTAYVYADSGGSPDNATLIGSSSAVSVSSSSTPGFINFNFGLLGLSATTDYWVVVGSKDNSISGTFYTSGVSSGSSVKSSVTFSAVGPTWATVSSYGLYYTLYSVSASSSVNGVYDFRFGSASTQQIMAAVGGTLYYHAGTATPPLAGAWASLTTGLGSGQNNIWSFTTLKNYLFSLDYGNNIGRVWDGAAAYTTQLGLRPVGTFARSATGGTVATGTYKIMLVTTLTSGGYRSSAEYSVTTTAANDKVAGSAVVVNNTSATDFGFDAGATCTQVFMTLVGGSTYYLLPTGSSSVGNPLPNGTTSFNITAPPAGTEATLLATFTKEAGYFTSQVTTPTCKFNQVFQNMLAMAGDASNPNRIWFSELNAPQIWSTRGGIEGNFLDLQDPSEGAGDVLNALKVWNGCLYAFKRHSIYIIEYTGVASAPFNSRRITGNIGALSHWGIKETMKGLVFLSERGPAICYGTFASIIESAKAILNKFDPNDSTRYNLAAMQYTTSGINSTKSQIHFGVSSTSATTRDLTLVYDFENDCFWENDITANYYAEVTDSNFFNSIWSGDYSAQVFQHDSGTNDNGSAISFYFDTPLIALGMPFHWKMLGQIFISGTVQSSGTLLVDVFLENSQTADVTLSYDMTDAGFKSGQSQSYGGRAKMFRLRIRNADLDVPVQIDSIGFGYEDRGTQIG